MELVQWFFMGVLFTLSAFWLAYLSTRVTMPWYSWAMMIAGKLSILLGIGWAGASFLEGVAQSGAMGLILFSITGILLIMLAWRWFMPKSFKL